MLSSSHVLIGALLLSALAQPALAINDNAQDLTKSLFDTYKGEPVQSIADAARRSKRLAGTAVASGPLASDRGYVDVLNLEFDYITPENEGKWGVLQSAPGVWNFGPHDQVVNHAAANRKAVKGHTLVWHSQAPDFITSDLSASELQALLDEHMTTTMNRYAGQFYAWDVVNEAIDDDGTYRDSVYFQKLGKSFIGDAFYRARELDPGAKRFYNDYNIAGINAKSDAVYAMLAELKAQGVPVDGIGFQMHLTATGTPSYDEMVANFQRFAELGLDINISELDVRVSELPWDRPTRLAIQKQLYQRVVSACMKVQKCESVTTWGFTDMYSWVDSTFGEDDPLLFDERLNRKPGFFGMVDGFMGLPADENKYPNLVANGNLEAGLYGWTASGGTLGRSHLDGATGIAAVTVTDRTASWNGPAVDLSSVLRGGLTYDAEAFVAVAGTKRASANLSLHYRCLGEADAYLQLGKAGVRDSQYTAITGNFTLPECKLDVAELYVEGPAAGIDLRVDNVSVRPRILVPDDTGLGANIVENFGFELDEFGWFGFGDAVVTASTVQAATGSQSGAVTGRTATWQGPATSLLLEAEAGTNYRVLSWLRMAEGSAQINGTIKASCDGADQYLYIGSAQANADGWALLAGEVALHDCDLTDLVLYFEGPAAGADFYIDDVYVRQDLASAVPNILANGTFENGVGGWSAWGGSVLSATSTQAYTGRQSAYLTNRTGTWQGPVVDVLSQVVPGASYDISAWGRIAGNSSDNMFITVKTACADGSENYLQADAITASDTEWRQLQGSVTLPDCPLTQAFVYFDGPAESASIYLDDVVMLGQVQQEVANRVGNSGFENGLADWVSWGGVLSVSSDAYAGAQSALLAGRTADWQGPVYNLLPNVDSGASYTISAFSKLAGLTAADMNITVKTTCEDGTSAYNWAGATGVNSTGWTEVAGAITLPACPLTEVSLYFSGPAAEANIYLDEVTVLEAAQ